MKKEQFDIVLERQTQRETGKLMLQIDESGVSGCIVVLDSQSYFRGKILRKNHYIFSMRLQIGAWTEDCDALLLAKEDGTLRGVLLSPWQVWTLTGRRSEQLAQYA